MGLIMWLISKITGRQSNYVMLARNMAIVRALLEEEYSKEFDDEDAICLAAGIIDTWLHLEADHFAVKDLVFGLRLAKQGRCGLGFKSIPVESGGNELETFFCGVEDLWLNYVLQVECLIMRAVSEVPSESILYGVQSQRKAVQKTLNANRGALLEGKDAGLWREIVKALVEDSAFKVRMTEALSETG